ncbi:MAG: PilC/PilY family type IV pilus protein, partial [Burkholderiales bacterium]
VLLIQYVDGAKELLKIGTNGVGANGNGLSAPRLVDINGDKIPDVAYAGDMLGNLWKFDLTDKTASNWSVAFSGTPLYVAKDVYSVRQPITTAPGWLFHPNGGIMVAVGTGRNITVADRTNDQVQTLYGIYDPTGVSGPPTTNALTGSTTISLDNTNNAVTTGRSELVEQTVSSASTAIAANGDPLWTVSHNPVPYSGVGAKKGWYMELPVNREAAVKNMNWVQGLLFGIPTRAPDVGGDPTVESCEPTGSEGNRYFTILNIINGSPPSYQIFAQLDSGGNVMLNDTGNKNNRLQTDGESALVMGVDDDKKNLCPPGVTCSTPPLPGSPLRLWPTWRQVQ